MNNSGGLSPRQVALFQLLTFSHSSGLLDLGEHGFLETLQGLVLRRIPTYAAAAIFEVVGVAARCSAVHISSIILSVLLQAMFRNIFLWLEIAIFYFVAQVVGSGNCHRVGG
ncbi:transmembrane protein, putative [Medicago truncatula]|uniref:Transmembrane protein, putative n=1 Tax=Medicago truncatula TaxID=3880 RepID=G7IM08_MEDTR|nr:transmembrane protein, putative [Medicago truncatula]